MYQQSMFRAKTRKKYYNLLSVNYHFTTVENRSLLYKQTALSPGEPRHPSQNAQRNFLPCVYVFFRRRENIDKKYYNCVLIESIGMEG